MLTSGSFPYQSLCTSGPSHALFPLLETFFLLFVSLCVAHPIYPSNLGLNTTVCHPPHHSHISTMGHFHTSWSTVIYIELGRSGSLSGLFLCCRSSRKRSSCSSNRISHFLNGWMMLLSNLNAVCSIKFKLSSRTYERIHSLLPASSKTTILLEPHGPESPSSVCFPPNNHVSGTWGFAHHPPST